MLKNFSNNMKLNRKAGLSVAMINIPLSISLAVASGASPLQGLLTGIWGGIFASIFASSKYNVFGVAGALSGILLSFALVNGPGLLPFIAIFSGIIMLLIYYFKITKYITLIPSTALHGFLIGVGISIAAGQFNAALGLTLPQSEKVYIGIWETIKHLGGVNIYAFLMFLVGFVFLFFTKKKYPNFPAVIILTIIGIGLGYAIKYDLLSNSHILLLSDKYHGMQFSFFQNIFSGVKINGFESFLVIFKKVFSISLIVAVIAILETIISAKLAQNITKDKFSRQKEVFGLAMSNIFSGLLGGLPATAVFVRTSLNIDSGAKNKYSAFLIGLFTLAFSLLFFNNGFLFLPYPIIAAILINIALGLIDIKHLKKLYSMQSSAFWVAIITAFVTVMEDATFGIIIGTVIALIMYIKRVTITSARVSIFRNKKFYSKLGLGTYTRTEQKDGDIILLKFSDGLNYLNQEKNIKFLESIDKKITIILSFSHMGDLDIDGVETINETFTILKNKGIEIYFSGMSGFFLKIISKTKIYSILHKERKIIDSTAELLSNLLGENYLSN